MNAACKGACVALWLASTAAAAPAHLELAITLNPGKRDLNAQAEILTDATGAYGFFLAQGLEVQSAEADNQPLNVVKTGLGRNRRFEVDLPDGPRPLRLRLRYGGTLVGLDPTLSHRDTLVALPPMASNDGSFFPAGSGWYPQPGALFTWRMTVRTPEHQVAAAPGTPQREEVRAGGRTTVFVFGQPSEGIDLIVGPYTVTERGARTVAGDVRIRTYFHAELGALASGYLEAAARYIARYSEQIAPYPYSHFSIVSSPLPVGFGMSSLTYLGRDVLRLPFIKDTSLGHEVLHNWWGNGVYVDVSRGNWSEGLTTFMADYGYKEDEGVEPARSMRHGWLRDYGAVAAADEQPLSEFRARYHTASSVIGYGKAAMLFYSLRERLGADGFRAALREFWEQHRFTQASFDDLAAHFQRHSSESLSGFFLQWLDQTGAPQIRVSEARNIGTADSPLLAVTLSQDFPDPSHRVPLRVFHAAGREDFVVELSGSSLTTEHVTRAPATALAIDPDFTVWRRLRPEESPPILRDVVAARGLEVHVLDGALKQAALDCAQGLAEGEVKAATPEASDPAMYRLIAGPARLVDGFLGERGLPRPTEVNQGDAQVWVVAERAQRLLIISLPVRIDDAKATLTMLGRRLPHLSRYSWLTFEKDRTAGRGNWPAQSPLIRVK